MAPPDDAPALTGKGGLAIVDVTNSASPTLKGRLPDSGSLQQPTALVIRQQYAFAAVTQGRRRRYMGGLAVMDISSVNNPTHVTTLWTADIGDSSSNLALDGNYAYIISSSSDRLAVLNVKIPSSPTFVGAFTDSVNMDSPRAVVISNGLAIIAAYYSDTLVLVDITTPSAPSLVGKLHDSQHLDGAAGVAVQGQYAYVASDWANSLSIVDISDKTSPKLVSYISDPGSLSRPKQVKVVGSYAYLTMYDSDRLTVVDVSAPFKPIIRARVVNSTTLNGAMGFAVRPTAIGNYIYIAAKLSNGLSVHLLSASPSSTNKFTPLSSVKRSADFYADSRRLSAEVRLTLKGKLHSATDLNFAYDVKVVGNYAYIASGISDGITVVNIADAGSPAIVGKLLDSTTMNAARALVVSGNYAYVASRLSDGLAIVDISDPTSPALRGTLLDSTKMNNCQHLAKQANYVYVTAYYSDGLTIIDVTNPAAPVLTGSLLDSATMDGARGVAVAGSYAFVAVQKLNSLVVIDVSTPTSPSVAGKLTDATNLNGAWCVALSAGYAYVTSFTSDSLSIIDVSTPAIPKLTGTLHDSTRLNAAFAIEIQGSFAYVAGYYQGVAVIDVSEATRPILKAFLQDEDNFKKPGGLTVVGGLIYVAAADSDNLAILEVSSANPSPRHNAAGDLQPLGLDAYTRANCSTGMCGALQCPAQCTNIVQCGKDLTVLVNGTCTHYCSRFGYCGVTTDHINGGINCTACQDPKALPQYGGYSAPVFVDLDGDNDLDIVIGYANSMLEYHVNYGNRTAPAYRRADDSPFSGIVDAKPDGPIPLWTPVFGDVDADGDYDMLLGRADGALSYYQNTGNQTHPVFAINSTTLQSPSPFSGIHRGVAIGRSSPFLRDMDEDGDLDVIVGEKFQMTYYRNVGTAQKPSYAHITGESNPFSSPIEYGGNAGFLGRDFVVTGRTKYGNSLSNMVEAYRDLGTISKSVFYLGNGKKDPFEEMQFHASDKMMTAAFGDLNGDGTLDAVLAFSITYGSRTDPLDGLTAYRYENNAGNVTAPRFVTEYGERSPFDDRSDSRGHNFQTLCHGTCTGYNRHRTICTPIKSEIDCEAAASTLRMGNMTNTSAGGMSVRSASSSTRPAGCYLEEEASGWALYFNSHASSAQASYGIQQICNCTGVVVGYYSSPAVADLDADGDLDMVVGSACGLIKYYRNTGSMFQPIFSLMSGPGSPFWCSKGNTCNYNIDTRSAYVAPWLRPSLVDLDDDGDYDLILSRCQKGAYYFRNTGSASTPVFTLITGDEDPFQSVTFNMDSSCTSLAFGDLDNDGDYDFVESTCSAKFFTHLNIGSKERPKFQLFPEARSARDPLFAIDIGSFGAPQLADLDSDGDLDVVAGHLNGFTFIQNHAAESYCFQHGTSDVVSETCQCLMGYSGRQCNIRCPGESNVCYGHGACYASGFYEGANPNPQS